MLTCCNDLTNEGEGYSQGKMASDLEYGIGLTLGLGE
jgi:hypothetical protein